MTYLIRKQKEYLLYPLSIKKFGNFSCPTCRSGYIDPVDAIIHTSKDPETNKFIQQNQFVQQEYKGQFNLVLKCSMCAQKFHVSGAGYYDYEHIDIHNWETKTYGEEYYGEEYWVTYLPKYFDPSPHLIELPEKMPKAMQKEMIYVFNLFWFDSSACGNRLRIVVERLLDFLDVLPQRNLHSRIEKLSDEYKKTKDYLLAIKWLGNEGSHESNLSRSDIVDALSLLEHIINITFADVSKELDDLAKQINEKKGSIKKHID
ncbi:MAG: DUF4145 domain-containing protein [Chloroflexi bacterium]|nr:DUF4145 domain-containing protein [Chloroflexota bacterium]